MGSASTTAVPEVPTAPSRVWLDHYPPGVPATIDVDAYASVRDVFEESCRRYPTRRDQLRLRWLEGQQEQ